MQTRDIIVIGGSAGALLALRKILGTLPKRLPAAFLVVIHTSPDSRSNLPEILSKAGGLPAVHPADGDRLGSGKIYVAPPDHHLLVGHNHLRVTRGPRENRFRPAIDPLFRTASAAYGPRVLGLLLSGGGDDGVLGLSYIKRRGGVAIVQDPDDAEASSMPSRAIRQVRVDHVLRADDMSAIIAGLVRVPVEEPIVIPNSGHPRDVAEEGTDALDSGILGDSPTPFTCPECGGALWDRSDGEFVRYQCHVGHGFSGESLVAAQSDGLEMALWTALRTLEESAALKRRMANHARQRGMLAIAERYEEHALETEERAKLVRRVLVAPSKPEAEVRSAGR